jgi:hypothetical protein
MVSWVDDHWVDDRSDRPADECAVNEKSGVMADRRVSIGQTMHPDFNHVTLNSPPHYAIYP